LINGYIVKKPVTRNTPYSTAVELYGRCLDRVFSTGWHVRSGKPIRIPQRSSMPEPDRYVARGNIRDYLARDPEPADVALVVEIADSSSRDDLALAQVYSAGGIPIYWIVNLVDTVVDVFSGPSSSRYQFHQIFRPGEEIAIAVDGIEIGRVAVSDMLP
jgi:Uma2 family endonuclease